VTGISAKTGPQVKGVALRTVDQCFRELRGAQLHGRAPELMDPELARTYRTLVLASAWYPIASYRETFRAYRAATGEGPELPRLVGKAAARHDMQGVHKQLFLKLVSPQVLLTMTQRVFGSYYDCGVLRVVESRKGYAHVNCSGCLGWDENMWAELLGSCEMQLELAGARHIRARLLSGGRTGDASAEMEAHWL
jgi:hypothetical protein